MDEYISKESAISIFEAKAEMAVCTPAQSYFHKAAKMIELLPAADVAPVRNGRWEMSEWISVKDRMPTDEDEMVLADESQQKLESSLKALESNEPLTLAELRKMRYGWVWVISDDPDLTVSGWAYVSETGAITIWEYKPDSIVGNVQLEWEEYGKTWIAYSHQPKDVCRKRKEI